MKINIGNIHDHFNRDVKWGKITISSDDNSKTTEVFICVSEEFLMEKYNTNNLKSEQVSSWFSSVCDEYRSTNESIFDTKYHAVVYATTAEGKKNGFDFLQKEVIPQ